MLKETSSSRKNQTRSRGHKIFGISFVGELNGNIKLLEEKLISKNISKW